MEKAFDEAGNAMGQQLQLTLRNNILSGREFLKELESDEEKALLIGNGFNGAFEIETGYSQLFESLQEDEEKKLAMRQQINRESIEMVRFYTNEAIIREFQKDYSLESLLSKEEIRRNQQSNQETLFRSNRADQQIKNEFINVLMKATQTGELEEQAADAKKLLENLQCSKFFTVNFDPWLYKLLLRWMGPAEDVESKSMQAPENNSLGEATNFFQSNKAYPSKYQFFLELPNHWKSPKPLSNVNKKDMKILRDLFEEGNWLSKEYDQQGESSMAMSHGKEKQRQGNQTSFPEILQPSLQLDDGFKKNGGKLYWQKNPRQNLFYLHGSLYIYEENRTIYKIASDKVSDLAKKIEEHRFSDINEVAIIFAEDGKREQIKKNNYLKHCYAELGNLKGALITYGVSFADNDKHISDKIKKNKKLKKIYISEYVDDQGKEERRKRIEEQFHDAPHQKHVFFDAMNAKDFLIKQVSS